MVRPHVVFTSTRRFIAIAVALIVLASCFLAQATRIIPSSASTAPAALAWSLNPSSNAFFTSVASGISASNQTFFVAGTGTGSIDYSTDGAHWTATTTPDPSAQWVGVAANSQGQAVGVSASGEAVYVSIANLSWEAATFNGGTPSSFAGVTYGTDGFVAVTTDGAIYRSTDGGASWNLEATESGGTFSSVTATASGYVAVGLSSTATIGASGGFAFESVPNSHATQWQSSTISDEQWVSVAADTSGNVVAVAANGYVSTSSNNGHTFTNSSSAVLPGGTSSVAYGGGRFVSVAEASGTATSESSVNGSTWTDDQSATSATFYDWAAITFGAGAFVAVDASGASMVAVGAQPPAPTNVAVVKVGDLLYVTWDAPSNTIGELSYTVSLTDTSLTEKRLCVGSHYTACVLNDPSRYIVGLDVKATNAIGSQYSSFVPIYASNENAETSILPTVYVASNLNKCFSGFAPGSQVAVVIAENLTTLTADSNGNVCFSIGAKDPSIRINGGPWINVPYGAFSITVKGKAPDGQLQSAISVLRLAPKGLPSAPLGLKAAVKGRSVTFVWGAPHSNGGHRVTGYHLWVSGTKKSCLTHGTSCTVTGLSKKQRYRAIVVAMNSVGLSPATQTNVFKG